MRSLASTFQSRKRLQNRYCPRRMWLCEISDVVMCKKMWLCRAIAKTDLTASCPSSIMPLGHHAHWPSCPLAIMPIGHHAHWPTCPLVNMPIGHHAHRQSYLSPMPIKHVAYIIMPIEYCAYQPLYQMTIMPYQQSCICSFKPFGLSVAKATLESQMSVCPSV